MIFSRQLWKISRKLWILILIYCYWILDSLIFLKLLIDPGPASPRHQNLRMESEQKKDNWLYISQQLSTIRQNILTIGRPSKYCMSYYGKTLDKKFPIVWGCLAPTPAPITLGWDWKYFTDGGRPGQWRCGGIYTIKSLHYNGSGSVTLSEQLKSSFNWICHLQHFTVDTVQTFRRWMKQNCYNISNLNISRPEFSLLLPWYYCSLRIFYFYSSIQLCFHQNNGTFVFWLHLNISWIITVGDIIIEGGNYTILALWSGQLAF